MPITAALLALPTRGLGLLLLAGYPLLLYRTRRGLIHRGWSPADATLYAAFCTLGKFPQVLGAAKHWLNRLTGRRAAIIEHKGSNHQSAGLVREGMTR